jgi:hypothetical protein
LKEPLPSVHRTSPSLPSIDTFRFEATWHSTSPCRPHPPHRNIEKEKTLRPSFPSLPRDGYWGQGLMEDVQRMRANLSRLLALAEHGNRRRGRQGHPGAGSNPLPSSGTRACAHTHTHANTHARTRTHAHACTDAHTPSAHTYSTRTCTRSHACARISRTHAHVSDTHTHRCYARGPKARGRAAGGSAPRPSSD